MADKRTHFGRSEVQDKLEMDACLARARAALNSLTIGAGTDPAGRGTASGVLRV